MHSKSPHFSARASGHLAAFLLAFLFVSLRPLRAAAAGSTGTLRGTISNAAAGPQLVQRGRVTRWDFHHAFSALSFTVHLADVSLPFLGRK